MRYLFTILLFIATEASAQIEMFHAHNFTQPALLLDTYGADISYAYSFRKLRTAYTGNCIQAKRLNDNATQDIGFVNGYLDTISLKSFVGSNSAIISIWYDQSATGLNATTSNLTNYFIVESGSIVYLNGFVSVRTVAQATNMSIVNTGNPGFNVLFGVTKNDSYNTVNYIAYAVNGRYWTGGALGGVDGVGGFDNTNLRNGPTEDLNRALLYWNSSSGSLLVSRNNGSETNTGSFPSNLINSIVLFGPPNVGSLQHLGRTCELIFYNQDKSADKSSILSNINAYYSIY